jgi:CBS domain containing-hemolysin-like protein
VDAGAAGGGDGLTGSQVAWRLGFVLALVAVNAFFVAAEFALVGARRSKIDQLAEGGDASARLVQRILDRLDLYISSAQLGITLASLGLGWIGEQTFALLFDRLFALVGLGAPSGVSHGLAATVTAYVVLTFLHITLGEQTPKSAAIVGAEGVARWTARPLLVFTAVMSPFIRVLNASNNALLRLLRLPAVSEKSHVHTPEELRMLVMQARAHGTLDESDSAMLAGVFDFHDKKAYDVMRPRTDVAAIDVDSTEEEVWTVMRAEGYSRYPVYRDTLDDIIGVLLAKDVWLRAGPDRRTGDGRTPGPFSVETWCARRSTCRARAPPSACSTTSGARARTCAWCLDEYGGTAGSSRSRTSSRRSWATSTTSTTCASARRWSSTACWSWPATCRWWTRAATTASTCPRATGPTLGGYVFSTLGRLPRVGDRAAYPGGRWRWWRWTGGGWRRCACTAARRRRRAVGRGRRREAAACGSSVALGAAFALACGAGLLAAGCRPGASPAAPAASTPAAARAPDDSIVPRGPRGATAARFPAPTRPVSAIVAPRWTDEDTRDDAGEVARVVRLARVGPARAWPTWARATATTRCAWRPWWRGGRGVRAGHRGALPRPPAAPAPRAPQPGVDLALGEPHDPRGSAPPRPTWCS